MEAPLAPDNNPILRIINGVHNLTHFDILPRALSALETEVAALLPALHQLPMYDLCLLQYKPTLKHLAVPLYCSGTVSGRTSVLHVSATVCSMCQCLPEDVCHSFSVGCITCAMKPSLQCITPYSQQQSAAAAVPSVHACYPCTGTSHCAGCG